MLTTLAIGLTGNLELLAGGLIAVVMLFAVIRKLTIPKRVKDQAESDNISDAEMLAPIRKAEHRGLGFGEKEEKVWTNDSDVEIKVANGEVTSIRRNPNKIRMVLSEKAAGCLGRKVQDHLIVVRGKIVVRAKALYADVA